MVENNNITKVMKIVPTDEIITLRDRQSGLRADKW